MSIGVSRRMKRLMPDGRAVVLAFDQALEHGPGKYPGVDLKPERIFSIAEEGGADAVLVHKGNVRRKLSKDVNLIVKLTGKTSLSTGVEFQSLVTQVEDAVAIGADAVAVGVYVACEEEGRMLAQFGRVWHEARSYGLPVIAFMYPRPKNEKKKCDADIVSYAARVGQEIGADIVKTYYTGDGKSWGKVVEAASGTPVFAAGGKVKEKEKEVIQMVEEIVKAGGAGIAVGRNVWMREGGAALLKKIVSVVH